ncbi:mitochondrial 18 KDa protein-domain-containing protein [Protomyces lactucae-debilis]|uniref:Mitochondrial fission process protein 1 n=1 Tax=Protomyces lactucae-debilis TaxID=2754530 RepID=A0A1Y2FWC9_PROLT|nr:mitochondrial 18 KDa protein-domain-containing protein [Protomyces lactucae-debilis]ORY87604.1 mitochondrial 18 KDa protein-domain-containing protein [Protomyces lactucae-debilis]
MSKTITEQATEEVKEVKTEIVEGQVDSLDSNARYLGYLARAQRYLLTSSRYVAYTSDIGEAFRPVVPPAVVTAGYAVSWLYLIGDVGYEGYKAKYVHDEANGAVGTLMVKRSIFQGLASMALPAFTIHSTVKYSAKLFKNVQNPKVNGWGPTVMGLAVVPALPYLFDHPVEYAVDTVFDKIEAALGVSAKNESRATRDPEAKKEL